MLKRVSTVFCVLGALVLNTMAAHPAVTDVRFGIVCPWNGLDQMGIGSVRTGAGATALGNWAEIHKSDSVLDWTRSDAELNGPVLTQGLSPLVILGYTPDWLATDEKHKAASVPARMYPFHQFVQQAAKRYSGKVRYYEVWNEPDTEFLQGTVVDYVNLLKTAHFASRSTDPDSRIVFGGLAGVNPPYMEAAYALGAKDSFDIMAVHPYQWDPVFNDEWFVSQMASLRALMNRHGDSHKPIWITEMGWSTASDKITPEIQARLLTQSIATALTLENMGVERFFWFVVKDWGGPGYGLLDVDGAPKPAATAYKTLTSQLMGLRYEGSTAAPQGIRCHVFSEVNGPRQVAVVWSGSDQPQEYILPAIRVLEVKSNLGQPIPLASDNPLKLNVTQDPLFVAAAFAPESLSDARDLPAFTKQENPGISPPSGVWISPRPDVRSSTPSVVPGKANLVPMQVFNHTDEAAMLMIMAHIPGASAYLDTIVHAKPKSTTDFNLTVVPSSDAPLGPATLELRVLGISDKATIHRYPIHIGEGDFLQFTANSHIERLYLQDGSSSATAPSVRFGSRWEYKLPIDQAGEYRLEAEFGAHNDGPWAIEVSQDGESYRPVLKGKSSRNTRKAILELEPGSLYLRFSGTDAQLGSLLLAWTADEAPEMEGE